jgi:hypothetical protein
MALEMQESLIRSLPPADAGGSLNSVNETLEEFGLPPIRTMTVIRKCRGYIAGSAVLAGRPNLPRERQFPPKDIDVYIPLKYSEIFKNFLLESGERHMCRETIINQPQPEDRQGSSDPPGRCSASSLRSESCSLMKL